MAKTSASETPMMRQFRTIKAKYKGCILLFRVGDFYETFGEDALITSEILGITLTKRNNGGAGDIPMAGIPHHALDSYLPRLVRAGKRVAICDQLEEPQKGKTVVRRGVTEIITPGINLNDQLLDRKHNNYLCVVHQATEERQGIAFLDLSTGDFFCAGGNRQFTEKLLYSLAPAEVVVARPHLKRFQGEYGSDFYTYSLDEWAFEYDNAREEICRHFGVANLKGFGLEEEAAGVVAAGVLLYYLKSNEQHELRHLNHLYRFQDDSFLGLDRFTVRNLELLHPLHPDGKSLVEVLDHTHTPMGARLLRRWLAFPLRDLAAIQQRQQAVQALVNTPDTLAQLEEALGQIGDLERLISRLATQKINPKQLQQIGAALERSQPVLDLLQNRHYDSLAHWLQQQADIGDVVETIGRFLAEDCPAAVHKGGVIRPGVSPQLDEYRQVQQGAAELLEQIVARERAATGISSLKVGYNKVFGYYLEVTHTHRDKAPDSWQRKQTLTNAERYITDELKELEEKVFSAEERIATLEQELYDKLVQRLGQEAPAMQRQAQLLAELDVLASFARQAVDWRYCRPQLHNDEHLLVKNGRHPVIETLLPRDSPYVPNDLYLNPHSDQILIITGPNMAGKSAVLRQTALITLLAHVGAFVPADQAEAPLTDKIYTRVGASDNLSAGESTFMVEMSETARIANNVTNRSLVLLDEIGRGTSTYDGLSIAWALVEFLHNEPEVAAKTLFATHYHELAELADQLERVRNYTVKVVEREGRILFLRKLEPGASERSFGIHVAEMAGMPRQITQRATEILHNLEQQRQQGQSAELTAALRQPLQLRLFDLDDKLGAQVKDWIGKQDPDHLTPVEALLRLHELKQLVESYQQEQQAYAYADREQTSGDQVAEPPASYNQPPAPPDPPPEQEL